MERIKVVVGDKKISSTDYHFKAALLEFDGKCGDVLEYDGMVDCYLVKFDCSVFKQWIIKSFTIKNR